MVVVLEQSSLDLHYRSSLLIMHPNAHAMPNKVLANTSRYVNFFFGRISTSSSGAFCSSTTCPGLIASV